MPTSQTSDSGINFVVKIFINCFCDKSESHSFTSFKVEGYFVYKNLFGINVCNVLFMCGRTPITRKYSSTDIEIIE